MRYRIFNPDEYHKLLPIFPEGTLPDSAVSRIAVAETDDGDIAAFLVMQLVLHSEPIWVAPEHRGRVSLSLLLKTLEKEANTPLTYYAFSPSKRIDRIIALHGFSKQPWTVWSKTISEV